MKKLVYFIFMIGTNCSLYPAMPQEISPEDREKIDVLDAQARYAECLNAAAQTRTQFEANQRKAAQMAFLQPSKKIDDIHGLFNELNQELNQRDSQRRHVIANSFLICAAIVGSVGLALECMQHECKSGSFKCLML